MIDIKRSANRPRANFSNNFEELLMDKQKVVSLPMSKIEPFSFNGDPQPFAIDENEISALADSISKCGLITPIIVRSISSNSYQILSGHKRYAACKKLMHLDIDAVVIEVTDDNVAFDIVCQANIQRKEPRPSELSKMFNTYLSLRKNVSADLTVNEISNMFGISRKTIYRYANISNLYNGLAELIDSKSIQIKFIEPLAKLSSEQQKAISDYYNYDERLSSKELTLVIEQMTDSGSSDIYDIIKAIRNLSEKKKEPYKNSLYNEMYIKKSSCMQNMTESELDKIVYELLDKYLEKMDFRQYAQVDRTTLLEVLITRRMFRQAMVIVEEFGYEGLDLSCLLKMTSRMILKSDMAEDDELLALASEVYRKGKYDEVILHYLMLYRFGPLDELISIWKSARGFEMDTYDLEERILSLLIFTEDYRKEGEAVLESYVKQSGKERITGAYLTLVSYGVFVREYTMSTFIRSRLEYAFTSKWPVNLICRLALLQEISREKDPKPEYVGMAQSILEECAKENLKFAFFRKLSPELLSPYQLDDKTFVECRAVPGAKVTLFYRLDTGLGAETAYKCEPLKEMYQGIFVRTFTLFYGETLQYYFQIDEGDKDNTRKTSERSVSMKKVEGASGSKYQMLNQMLSARRLDKMQEVTDSLKDYLRQEQYVKNMFSIEKESGR